MPKIPLSDSEAYITPVPELGRVSITLDTGQAKIRVLITPADAEALGRALLGAGPAPVVEPERPTSKPRHEWEGRKPRPGPSGRPPGTDRAPSSGKGLWRWLKTEEEKVGRPGLIGYLNRWARLQEFPAKIVEWNRIQVQEAHAEAVRKLAEIAAAPAELREEAMP